MTRLITLVNILMCCLMACVPEASSPVELVITGVSLCVS
jgi:hypothetical protein